MSWNRAQRRTLSRYGIGEKRMHEEFEKEHNKTREYAYYNAWASMFMALVDRFPALTGADLHSIAVDTMEYVNGLETPQELAQRLLDRTGFDIREKPSDSELPYIEKAYEE